MKRSRLALRAKRGEAKGRKGFGRRNLIGSKRRWQVLIAIGQHIEQSKSLKASLTEIDLIPVKRQDAFA